MQLEIKQEKNIYFCPDSNHVIAVRTVEALKAKGSSDPY